MASEPTEPFDCGTCRGEPAPPGTKTAREWDAEYAARNAHRPTIVERLADALFCTECSRFRFSPGHWLLRGSHSGGEQHGE
ncbi:MAG TPA: hypothetical protein VGH54_21325 [Mycobacterium sp.]|jgi:hypothetical protein|uniref:hypothetical protein n=1 Tax=Mycobacterium sp. TaxID=1785 RepID=UPI002F3FB3AF